MQSERGTPAQAFRNTLPPRRPYGWWLATTARNLARRITLRRGCCGHPGEPGC